MKTAEEWAILLSDLSDKHYGKVEVTVVSPNITVVMAIREEIAKMLCDDLDQMFGTADEVLNKPRDTNSICVCIAVKLFAQKIHNLP